MRTADQKRIHNQHRTGNLARWSDMPPDTGEPVHDFLAAASRVESLETYRTTRIDGYTPTFEVHQYMKSPVELWARATAQWARREIDGDAMAGTSPRMHTFTADEIDALAPRIEAVLDARGQLRR